VVEHLQGVVGGQMQIDLPKRALVLLFFAVVLGSLTDDIVRAFIKDKWYGVASQIEAWD